MNNVESSKLPLHIQTKKHNSIWKDILGYKYIYLLLLPGLIFFFIFKYMPMYGIQLAFKDYMINQGVFGSPWIGLVHFKSLLIEPEFKNAFFNTLIISFMKIVIGFPIPIILSLLINEMMKCKYKSLLQTVFTFPHFLSWVVVGGIVAGLLSSTGAINNLFAALGLPKHSFMTDKSIFRYILVLTEIWKEAGWSTIIYLAAMTSIDPTLYEAATVDGVNRFQKILYITLPGITSISIILLILSVGNVMEAGFMQVFNMYNPAVYSVSDIIDTYVYRITFQRPADFGFSTAVGLFKGLANLILMLLANKFAKSMGHSGII